MKLSDVVTSLDAYKSALEQIKAKKQSSQEEMALESTDGKSEIMEEALASLQQEPILATLVCLIGDEPATLEFFVNTLRSIKATKEKKEEVEKEPSKGKMEPTIGVGELLMLILMCDLIS